MTMTREGAPAKNVLVGKLGRMGAMLCARADQMGVCVAGVDRPLNADTLSEACADADMALFCVPASALDEVLAGVCPHLPDTAVVADITSVKEQPLRLMEKFWPGAVVGAHPLFGPAPDWETDLPVAVIPGSRADTVDVGKVEAFFLRLGFRTFRTTALEHDRAMAHIQNVNFITSLAYFALLAGHDELLPFLTPSFRRRLDAARKMLTEDARMFAGLFEANAHSHESVRQYRRVLNLAAAGEIDLLCRRARWWYEK